MKTTKWIIAAICFILAGGIIFTCIMSIANWDFTILDTTEYKTIKTNIDEDFKSISIDANEADIVFVKEDAKCAVSSQIRVQSQYTVVVEDETLKIKLKDSKKWYDQIAFFSFKEQRIKVSLPQDVYDNIAISLSTGDIEIPSGFSFDNVDIKGSTGGVDSKALVSDGLKITLSTGDININNTTVGNMNISVSTGDIHMQSVECHKEIEANVSTGDIKLTDTSCGAFVSSGNTGDIKLVNVDAGEKFYIKRTTGDVTLDMCDADEIYIKTTTGDVEGSLLSEKVFVCNASSGDIDVPKTKSGGKCEIITNTGDIEIEIVK